MSKLPAATLFGAIFVLATWATVSADEQPVFVSYRCDRSLDRVMIEYKVFVDESTEAINNANGPDRWNPWNLVDVDNGVIVRTRTVTVTCQLSDGNYTVKIGPTPWNNNFYGPCGAVVTAWVSVAHGASSLGRYEFEPIDCSFSEHKLITKIVVRGGKPNPELTTVSEDLFYHREVAPTEP